MTTATHQRDERRNQRAKEVVAEHDFLTLTPRDWQAFLAVLDDADRPRPRLEAAARRHLARRRRDGLCTLAP